jgi:chemotaxis protein methyltransferase CheR
MTRLRHHDKPEPVHLSELDLGWVRHRIGHYSGLELDEREHAQIANCVRARMGARNCREFGEYRQLLDDDEDELRRVIEGVTIGETSFFRHARQFAVVRDDVLPEMVANGGLRRPLRMWSAGCATGEEAYTLAMLLCAATERWPGLTGSVIGTDLNEQYLQRARQALYGQRSVRDVPPELLERFFSPLTDSYQLSPSICSQVSFEVLNLVDDCYPSARAGNGDFDIIFCRNVLIYFAASTAETVVQRLAQCLRSGGYLFLGHAESLRQHPASLEVVRFPGVWAYRRPLDEVTAQTNYVQATTVARRSCGFWPAGEPKLEHDQVGREPAPCATPTVNRIHALKQSQVEAPPGDEGFPLLARAIEAADRGDSETAVELCHAFLQAEPCTADAYSLLGVLYRSRGDVEGALAALRRGLYLDRTSPVLHWQLAQVYQEMGNAKEALREYRLAQRYLGGMAADEIVPHTDGISYGALREMVRKTVRDLVPAE